MAKRDFRSTYRKKQDYITFQFYGNWDRVQYELDRLDDRLKNAADWGQRKAVEAYIKELKSNISSDKYGYGTSMPKQYNAKDGRPWINTSTLLGKITSWRSKYVYYAGIKAGEMAPNGRIELRYVAKILELGNPTRGIPARPVWVPTYRDMGGAKFVKRTIAKAIYNKVKRLREAGFTVEYKSFL